MSNKSRKPKVAWLSPEPTPYRLPFFEALERTNELDIHFFYCRWESPGRPWSLDRCGRATVSVLSGVNIPVPWKHRTYLMVNPGIIPVLFRKRWDLFVISGYDHPTMLCAIFVCLARGIPFLIHGESHLLKHRPWLVRTLKRLLLFPLLRRCRAALPTGSAARQYWESIGVDRDRIFIVANTPDISFFRRQACAQRSRRLQLRADAGIAANALVGVFVGRLVERKGVDILIEALSLIEESRRPTLLIVGEGPLRGELERVVRERQLPVHFLGWLQNHELPAVYAMSDFFVLPSREEPWGVVVNEAMASELSVVLSDRVGAAYDLLQDGQNGFLVAGCTAAAWRDALARCMQHRNDLPRMGKVSSQIISGWTYEKSIAQLLLAVRKALGRESAGSLS